MRLLTIPVCGRIQNGFQQLSMMQHIRKRLSDAFSYSMFRDGANPDSQENKLLWR